MDLECILHWYKGPKVDPEVDDGDPKIKKMLKCCRNTWDFPKHVLNDRAFLAPCATQSRWRELTFVWWGVAFAVGGGRADPGSP